MSAEPVLVIANRNYSSWSLRPWLAMRGCGIAFRERQVLFGADFAAEVRAISPAGRVPVLLADDQVIWDSLAIIEYLAETYPDHGIWPREARARALARSICAEMHAGFGSLRQQMPMNIEARLPGRGWNLAVQADIDRMKRER